MSTPAWVAIKELEKYIGESVSIIGNVSKLRQQKKISFIELTNGNTVQIVAEAGIIPPKITLESTVKVIGTVSLLPKGAHSKLPVELQAQEIEVLSLADESYSSICPPEAGPAVRLSERHFYFRDKRFVLITKSRAQLLRAIREYYAEIGYTEITPPSFTGTECEGGATLFKVEHPGKSMDKPMTAYLTQSSQFALEMVLPGVGDCYCIAPSFRAEHSHTRRHLTEFTHVEHETGYVMSFEQHLEILKNLIEGIIRHFLLIASDTLTKLGVLERVQELYEMTKDILILTHSEAIKKCRELGIKQDNGEDFGDRDDIPETQERQLIETINKIVFLTEFPKEFKSFYMAPCVNDPSLVQGCDVEFPGIGEVIGSGVREANYESLRERLKENGLKEEDYKEYLDLRKFGFRFTSGMGLGLDRLLTCLLGENTIRCVTTFPRFPGYIRP